MLKGQSEGFACTGYWVPALCPGPARIQELVGRCRRLRRGRIEEAQDGPHALPSRLEGVRLPERHVQVEPGLVDGALPPQDVDHVQIPGRESHLAVTEVEVDGGVRRGLVRNARPEVGRALRTSP